MRRGCVPANEVRKLRDRDLGDAATVRTRLGFQDSVGVANAEPAESTLGPYIASKDRLEQRPGRRAHDEHTGEHDRGVSMKTSDLGFANAEPAESTLGPYIASKDRLEQRPGRRAHDEHTGEHDRGVSMKTT